MRTVTSTWNTAFGRQQTVSRASWGLQPIFLVDFWGIARTFATRSFTPTGGWLADDGLLADAGVLAEGDHVATEQELARLRSGGIGAIRHELDESRGTVRIGNASVILRNEEDLYHTFDRLDNSPVRIRLGASGLTWGQYLTVFLGIVDRHELLQSERESELRLDLIAWDFTKHRDLNQLLGVQYFPGTPQSSRNQAIPIALGICVDAPTIQVVGDAQGTLAFALSTSSTALLLTEFGAGFPPTGEISINTETAVTYSSRRLVNVRGTTYLRLEGLTRGSPATHSVGQVVTLTSVDYTQLISYSVSALNAVRDDGAVITSGYTLEQFALGADRPVSLLHFTTQPGTITVDVNAGNIDMANLLENGGFETGTTSGWTVGASATATVATSNPNPDEGTYRLELEGSFGVYRDFYQEFDTVPGELYQVSFVYRNEDNNLLTNGGFETADLTGWTISYQAARTVYAIMQAGGLAGTITIPGIPNAVPVSWDAAADGDYFLVVTGVPGSPYELRIYQDVGSLTTGQVHTLSLFQISQQFFPSGGSAFNSAKGEVGIAVGITTNPGLYISERYYPAVNLLQLGILPWASGGQLYFTPTVATARVTLILRGLQQGLNHLPAFADALRLQLANILDVSLAGVQVGTPSDPDLLADEDLELKYVWTAHQVTFRAEEARTRLTLRSQFTITAHNLSSYFDRVEVNRIFNVQGGGGANPAETIAYVEDRFLPYKTRDTASFEAAYLELIDWKFGAFLTAPGDSRALLQRMASQANSVLLEDQYGRDKIVVLSEQRASVWGFEYSNILRGTFHRVPEPIDNVYTHFTLYFGAKTGGSTNPADFAGSVFASPEGTTIPAGATYLSLCENALQLYGREHKRVIFAEFIQDLYTAHLALQAEVRRYTQRHDLLTFQTWPDAAVLEVADVITVAHTLVGDTPLDCEIMRTTLLPDRVAVEIEARVLRVAGWTEECNYDPIILDFEGWEDEAEFGMTLTEGLGFDEEANS